MVIPDASKTGNSTKCLWVGVLEATVLTPLPLPMGILYSSFVCIKRPRWWPVKLNNRHLQSHRTIGDYEQPNWDTCLSLYPPSHLESPCLPRRGSRGDEIGEVLPPAPPPLFLTLLLSFLFLSPKPGFCSITLLQKFTPPISKSWICACRLWRICLQHCQSFPVIVTLHKWYVNLNNNTYTSLASHSCENFCLET